jgi:hypothetical protein
LKFFGTLSKKKKNASSLGRFQSGKKEKLTNIFPKEGKAFSGFR